MPGSWDAVEMLLGCDGKLLGCIGNGSLSQDWNPVPIMGNDVRGRDRNFSLEAVKSDEFLVSECFLPVKIKLIGVLILRRVKMKMEIILLTNPNSATIGKIIPWATN